MFSMCHRFFIALIFFLFVEFSGSMIDRVTVFCATAQELQEWLENLQPFIKGGSPAGTITKVITHTRAHTHTYVCTYIKPYSVKPTSKSETCTMTKC